MNTTTNTTTLLEDLQELRGEPFGESLTTNNFGIFLFLIFFNFLWTLCQLDGRALYNAVDCQTHNNDLASENNLQSTRLDFMSRHITSRNVQYLAVTYSSFLLLAQLIEGYWVCQICPGLTPIRFAEWTESTSHFNPAVLRYIFNLRAVVVLLPMWLGPLGFGAVILDVQWRYTKELLTLEIKGQNKGHCQGRQCPAETAKEENGSEVDLKFGLFVADKDVAENLFGTTYR